MSRVIVGNSRYLEDTRNIHSGSSDAETVGKTVDYWISLSATTSETPSTVTITPTGVPVWINEGVGPGSGARRVDCCFPVNGRCSIIFGVNGQRFN